jgi:predicted hotdog family 3-hydroxylacyl-ACP dehydratase
MRTPPLPDVAALLPHAPPARLIHAIAERQGEGLACLGTIPPDSPFAEDGRAPAYLGLEMAAQAAAVLEALDRTDAAPAPQIGYLVGVRDARFHTLHLPVGRPLRVEVRPTGSAPPLAVYEIKVELDGEEVVTGTLSTYIAAEAG